MKYFSGFLHMAYLTCCVIAIFLETESTAKIWILNSAIWCGLHWLYEYLYNNFIKGK
jgi:hypothetical protein